MISQRTHPRGVDDEDAVFHLGKLGVGEETASLGRQGAVDRDDIGGSEELVERDVRRVEGGLVYRQ